MLRAIFNIIFASMTHFRSLVSSFRLILNNKDNFIDANCKQRLQLSNVFIASNCFNYILNIIHTHVCIPIYSFLHLLYWTMSVGYYFHFYVFRSSTAYSGRWSVYLLIWFVITTLRCAQCNIWIRRQHNEPYANRIGLNSVKHIELAFTMHLCWLKLITYIV